MTKVIVGVIVGTLVLCFSLGIGGQVYLSTQNSPEKRQVFKENMWIWLGDNGVILSFLSFLAIIIFIIGMYVFIKHVPYWQQEIHTYGGKFYNTVDDIAAKLSNVSDNANVLMKTLPNTMIEAASVISMVPKKHKN